MLDNFFLLKIPTLLGFCSFVSSCLRRLEEYLVVRMSDRANILDNFLHLKIMHKEQKGKYQIENFPTTTKVTITGTQASRRYIIAREPLTHPDPDISCSRVIV